MWHLILTSFLWAFSFGLLKNQLDQVDPTAVSTLRLALSLLVFLPFMRVRQVSLGSRLRLSLIGAVQFGAMYLFYNHAFHYLKAYEVALFTVFTPLYIVVIDALLEREWHWRFLFAALLAATGAAIIRDPQSLGDPSLKGFLLIQGSNLCFAVGQLLWRREHKRLAGVATDAQLFALPYAGGVLLCLLVSCFTTQWSTLHLTTLQGLSIAYLGIVASGLCFFWWNVGAERVNAGTLAVMNNAKMPLAVACALFVFGEHAHFPRLLIGGLILVLAVWIAEKGRNRSPDPYSKT